MTKVKASIYQIYPASFCDTTGSGSGDLNGITSKLEYLKDLGVDVVWLSPVYKSPMHDMGYDISDYKAINPAMGTMEDWDRMLAKAHKLGLKLVMVRNLQLRLTLPAYQITGFGCESHILGS